MAFTSDKFKNLIEYKSGYTWSKDQENSKFSEGSVRVLTVTNIQEKLDLRSELYLTNVSQKDRNRKAASKGWSIAVSSNGNRKRIGNAVFIADDTDYLFASFLTGFIPKDSNVILPKYFFYWLSSHPVQERITSVSEGTTGLGNLDIRCLRNTDIDYPKELSEQKAIAGILAKVDDAIEAVDNSIKAAERLKKSLMQNLLTGKLKPDGTWRSEDEFYEDVSKHPKSWESDKFKNLIKYKSGYTWSKDQENSKFSKGSVRVLTVTNIQEKLDLRSELYLTNVSPKDRDRKAASKGWSIAVSSNGNRKRIGNAVFIADDTDYLFASFLTGFIPKDSNVISPKYFFYWLSSYPVQERITAVSEGTTGLGNLDIRCLRNTDINYPKDVHEQNMIVQVIESIEQDIFSKQSKIKSLKTLKNSLMQNLLTGKVRVDVEQINKLLEGVES